MKVNVNQNALDYVKRLKQGALNKYSKSNLKHLSSISNAETSNDKTSSDTPAQNDISGDGQGSFSDTTSNTQAPNEGSSSDSPAPSEGSDSNTAGSSQGSSSDTPAPIDNTSGKDSNTTFLKFEGQSVLYYGKIIVGNQELNVIFDTGSSDLWIPNINCTSASCQNHNKFNSSNSTTFKSEGKKWKIQYGTGSASGVTGIDNIQIGTFTANKQTFGLADITADFFVQFEADGILGLGFDALNTIDNGAPTLISALIKQNKINPIFSFHFSHFTDFDDQATFTLGGVDESKFTGKINYTPVIRPKSKSIPNGFWVINLGDAKVNGKSLKISRDAIIDTGTTLMLVPENDAAAIHKKIPKSKFDKVNGVYIIPCNTTAVISLKFGGVNYDISHRDLLGSPFTDTLCISGIVPDQSDFWIVGQTFLKNVYSAFDVGNKKVGFALSK
ncbi:41675_t:CDS:2 [Gigaspora margarita]|uniref:41675_t:CDS:1 n=1 Tax=Gigaspora margarita TaxID=4874 RepID=A0ABN7UQE3_GIGMA|nr:41675_t:CDS:2 [Gigaspora margarita]